ncbi:MAG: lipoprotein [Pseudomonadota bacterium]
MDYCRSVVRRMALLVLASAITACGQIGPLYLPDDAQASPQPDESGAEHQRDDADTRRDDNDDNDDNDAESSQ